MVSPTPTAGGIKPLNVSASGVSTLLGVSRSMVHKLDATELLPRPIRIGRCKRWRVQDLHPPSVGEEQTERFSSEVGR